MSPRGHCGPFRCPFRWGQCVCHLTAQGGATAWSQLLPSCVHVFSQLRSWYRTCETTQVPFMTVVSRKTKGIQKERMWG